jgi:hypothetical protein
VVAEPSEAALVHRTGYVNFTIVIGFHSWNLGITEPHYAALGEINLKSGETCSRKMRVEQLCAGGRR